MNKLQNLPPIYYITLADSFDRQKYFEDQFSDYISDIHKIESYDGRKTNFVANNDIVYGNFLDNMDSGSIATVISHLKGIFEWYESCDSEYALFFEDDMSIESIQHWNFTWNDFINNLPENWKIIQLSLIKEQINDTDMMINSRVWWNWSAGAYLINRNYAKELKDHFYIDEKYCLKIKNHDDIIPCIEHCLFSLAEDDAYTIPLFYENVNFISTFYPHFIKETNKKSQVESANYVKYWWKIEGKNKNIIDLKYLNQKVKNFPSINFISVVESQERRNVLYNSFKKYNISSNITPHIYEKYSDNDVSVIDGPILNHTGKGPVTSHLKAIKKWYENTNEEYTLFCEDDLSLDTVKYWNFNWEDFFNALPQNWDLVQLCLIRDDMFLFFDPDVKLRNRCWCDWSAAAYLITRKHAKNLIDYYFIDDSIVLEYKGYDKILREQDGSAFWFLLPSVENIIYSNFNSNIYTFPLFVENISFSSTWSEKNKEATNLHYKCYEEIMSWWKYTGKNLSLNNLIPKKENTEDTKLSVVKIKDDYGLEEEEYILSLLPDKYIKQIETYTGEELIALNKTCDVLIYRIFGMSLEKFERLLKIIKPKIMINISDECYVESNDAFNQLGLYSKLYLRHFHHKNYNYTHNTIHIPLGFCSGVSLKYNQTIKKIKEKKYNWSWVGNFKNDRHEMIEKFKNIDKHFFATNISKYEIANLYNDSIFVPCGRGNCGLDCWRLYEASSCGAIPVVVGSKEEIEETFKYEENPPWVFANSWEEASVICKNLLLNYNLLQKKQEDLLLWWNNRINNIKSKINNVLIPKPEQKQLTIVQIGANRGYDDLYNYIQKYNIPIKCIILVEPQKEFNESLTNCYKNYNVIIENSIIKPKNNLLKTTTLYTHSNDLNKEVSSIKKSHVENHNMYFGESKIIETIIECLDIEELFIKYNLQNIDWLLIDIEGLDCDIIQDIDFKKYNISKIEYEKIHCKNNLDIEKLFMDNGYVPGYALSTNDTCFIKQI